MTLWYNFRKRMHEIDRAYHNRRKEFILFEPGVYEPLEHYVWFVSVRYFQEQMIMIDLHAAADGVTIPVYVFLVLRALREAAGIYSTTFAKYMRRFASEAARQRKMERELYKTLKARLDNGMRFKKKMRQWMQERERCVF